MRICITKLKKAFLVIGVLFSLTGNLFGQGFLEIAIPKVADTVTSGVSSDGLIQIESFYVDSKKGELRYLEGIESQLLKSHYEKCQLGDENEVWVRVTGQAKSSELEGELNNFVRFYYNENPNLFATIALYELCEDSKVGCSQKVVVKQQKVVSNVLAKKYKDSVCASSISP